MKAFGWLRTECCTRWNRWFCRFAEESKEATQIWDHLEIWEDIWEISLKVENWGTKTEEIVYDLPNESEEERMKKSYMIFLMSLIIKWIFDVLHECKSINRICQSYWIAKICFTWTTWGWTCTCKMGPQHERVLWRHVCQQGKRSDYTCIRMTHSLFHDFNAVWTGQIGRNPFKRAILWMLMRGFERRCYSGTVLNHEVQSTINWIQLLPFISCNWL